MSARSTMTMRATVSRDSTPGKTDWGRPEVIKLVEIGVVPCRAWSKVKREADDSGKSIVIEDMRAAVPVNADIQKNDRLVIRDRRGLMQFSGPVLVEAKVRRGGAGSRPSHFELMLKRHV